ncbi:MAG TPA: 3D domain-containing protein [Vicinamibacterales bacterium]|nr:3D domain-containing protein [Vicinamibacterales bacterium]
MATVLTAAAVVLLYDATVIDSRNTSRINPMADARGKVTAGQRLDFIATAYCRGQTTSSGVDVQAGIAAADEVLLPEGSVVSVDGVPEQYRGIYTVMDTGPKVLGRHVDLYMWNCDEAVEFGRRDIVLTVLRLGWNPKNTAPAIK